MDAHQAKNRLAACSSPYLQQHASNPVDWWPWCAEAIDQARQRDLPLFISIGYSTCHWCHVMERESFEDPAIGRALRQGFVAIKVDREEHPLVDAWLMCACQVTSELATGRASGGWPLNGFVDPHSMRAFHVGTYFPPTGAIGRPSFADALRSVALAWRERRDEVRAQAERLGSIVEGMLTRRPPPAAVSSALVRSAAEALVRFEDPQEGGFGGAPKFPQPSFLRLIREVAVDAPPFQSTTTRALDAMVTGGLFDQVAGGFHRYCVDRSWIVPHFEKMLYDNGQLLELLGAQHRRAPDARWSHAIHRTAEWLEREMLAPGGACCAALDAEVDAHEGANELWSPEEALDVLACLAPADREDALNALGLRQPNFQDPHHPRDAPKVIPTRRPWAASTAVDQACNALLATRQARPAPRRDEKVILEWNGLLIEGLAEAGRAVGSPGLVASAERIAAALLASHRGVDGWHRVVTHGIVGPRAMLADLACLGLGLESLWRATGNARWLDAAVAVEHDARVAFCEGGQWWCGPDDGILPVRACTHEDGATPSGLSAIIDLQVRLASALRTDERGAGAIAALANTLAAEGGSLAQNPAAGAWGLAALCRAFREGLLADDHAQSPAPLAAGTCRIICGERGCSVERA